MRQYSKTEIEDANKIPILDVITRLGITTSSKKIIHCVFHDEKSPSLSFDTRKNLWKCFGCGEGGNVISFVMKYCDVGFPEAIKWLQGEEIQYQTVSKIKKKAIKITVNPTIYKDFHSACNNDSRIRDFYCKTKRINEEIFTNAQIKLLGDVKSISQYLIRKWGEETLMKCGLFVKRTNKTTGEMFNSLQWYDPETMIIPFFDESDQINYLKGRQLSGERKHINSMGIPTNIYNRKILGQLNVNDKLYLCEGETDTLTALTMGLNAVGFLGANSFKKEYIELLKKYNLYIIPDNDTAGKKMGKKIKDLFFDAGKAVEIVYLMEDNDLNDYYARTNN